MLADETMAEVRRFFVEESRTRNRSVTRLCEEREPNGNQTGTKRGQVQFLRNCGDVIVITGGSATVNATVGQDVAVLSIGEGNTVHLNAGQDAYAWAAGVITGDITATRDVGVVTAGNSGPIIDAGQDAFLMAFDGFMGPIDAGRDAVAISMSNSTPDVTAGVDAFVYSFGSTSPVHINAGGYAGLAPAN